MRKLIATLLVLAATCAFLVVGTTTPRARAAMPTGITYVMCTTSDGTAGAVAPTATESATIAAQGRT